MSKTKERIKARKKSVKLISKFLKQLRPCAKKAFNSAKQYNNNEVDFSTMHKFSVLSYREGLRFGDPLSFACAALTSERIEESVEWIKPWTSVAKERK